MIGAGHSGVGVGGSGVGCADPELSGSVLCWGRARVGSCYLHRRPSPSLSLVYGPPEPVASGIVPGLKEPGGNVTGFALYEVTLGDKWLELLSEIAPGLKRARIMFNPDTTTADRCGFSEACRLSILPA